MHALGESVVETNETLKKREMSIFDCFIANPKLLSHYTILAGLTALGLVVAHVQISTRMICSSSPAIIWLLTWCHLQEGKTMGRRFVQVYTILFILLGIILHVNFLPWT